MRKKIALGMVLVTMMLTLMSTTSLVSAAEVGSFSYLKNIDIYDLTTWAGVPNATDAADDYVDDIAGVNATDILKVAICNNDTHLFVSIDVAGALPEPTPPAATSFAVQLYIEDAKHLAENGTDLFYTNSPIVENDMNASFFFSKWSNGGYTRFNYTVEPAWTWDMDLTNPATLSLLSSTGEVEVDDTFKFQILTVFSPDGGTTWLAEDLLDFGTYTIIPEFPSSATLLLILMSVAAIAIVVTKKFRRPKLV